MENQKDWQIKSLTKYKPLSRYIGMTGKIPVVAGYTYVGVEVELENITKTEYSAISGSTWKQHEDGSLKVKGREFVTVPIRFKYLEVELNRLFSGLKNPHPSSRCSIHVHVNVREMTAKELASFILLYSIYERIFYRLSGNRWDSNFCVPLYAAKEYPSRMLKFLIENRKPSCMEDVPQWYKYYGLNLCPIFGFDGSSKQGTVEFRHHKGSIDTKEIINWINLITSLKQASKRIDLATILGMLLEMNSDSSYISLTQSIFGKYADKILNLPTFKDDIEGCITSTKQIVFEKGEK